MVNIVGLFIFVICIYLFFQCMFFYIARCYPRYAASLFAANDFARSTVATTAVHFAHPLFKNLGVGKGVSMLAAFTCACIVGLFILWKFGPQLRARSRFAAK